MAVQYSGSFTVHYNTVAVGNMVQFAMQYSMLYSNQLNCNCREIGVAPARVARNNKAQKNKCETSSVDCLSKFGTDQSRASDIMATLVGAIHTSRGLVFTKFTLV